MGLLRSIFHIATLGLVDSNEEVARKNTPFHFPNNMTESDFKNLAIKVAKPIKRLYVTVDRQFVSGEVTSSSGINKWHFILDFNDYGTLTGKYWMRYIDNSDTQIPSSYAKQLRSAIMGFLASKS